MARITDIRAIAYCVPDLAAERKFYTEIWGLIEIAEADGRVYLGAAGDSEHHCVILRQGDVARVDRISFACDGPAELAALHQRLADAGIRIIAPPAPIDRPGGGLGFQFFSPDGLAFEISTDVAERAARPIAHWEALPVKVSHIVLHSPDHKALIAFFTDLLGFRVSDWLGDFMCFLRCNEAHHRLGILPGPPCLNHVAYDMVSVDDMMRGAARMKSRNHDLLWGPGRHTAGNNTFSYFTTPNNFAVEYTSELVEITDDDAWQPTIYAPGPGVMDQWGVGAGGPQTMPHPAANPGLFQQPG